MPLADFTLPVNTGTQRIGSRSAGPGLAGEVLAGNGAASDPTFQSFSDLLEAYSAGFLSSQEFIQAVNDLIAIFAELTPEWVTALENLTALIGSDPELSAAIGLIVETVTIGRSTTPVTGSSIGNATVAWAQQVKHDGFLTAVRPFGINSGGTIYIKRFTATGTYPSLTFTQVNSDYPLVIGTGANTYTVANGLPVIPVVAGEYIGLFGGGTTAGNQKIPQITDVADSGGTYGSAGGSGNVSSFSDSTVVVTSQIQIGFDITYVYVTTERTQGIEASVATLEGTSAGLDRSKITDYETIGLSPLWTPEVGADTGVVTAIYIRPVSQSGWIRRIRAAINSDTTLYVKVFAFDGTNFSGVFTQRGTDTAIALTTGVHTLESVDEDFEEIWVNAGEFVGWFANGKINFATKSGTDTEGGGYWSENGNLYKFQDTSISTQLYPQIGFDIYFEEFGSAKLSLPGQPLAPLAQVTPADVNLCTTGYESTGKGTLGDATFFAYESLYGHTMYGGGIRVARDGSIGEYHAPGTSTMVDAEEQITEAPGYDNDNETGTGRGVNGIVQLADEVSVGANQDYGVPFETHKFHLSSPGHGGYRLDQWGSTWRKVFEDQVQDLVPLISASETLKGLWHLVSIGNNGVQGITVQNGTVVWNLDEFDFMLEQELRSQGQFMKSVYGQNDQPHFFCIQISSYITGTGTANVDLTADFTSGSPVVENLSETTAFWNLVPGLLVTGPLVPPGTTILSVDSTTQITMSANATGDGTAEDVNFAASARDGVFQDKVLELQDRVPWFHVVGPEFFAPESSLAHFTSPGYVQRALTCKQPILDVCYGGMTPILPRRRGSYWNSTGVFQRIYSLEEIVIDDTTISGASAITTQGVQVRVDDVQTGIGAPTVSEVAANWWEIAAPWAVTPPASNAVVQFRLGKDYNRVGGLPEGAIHNFRTSYGETFTIDGSPWTARRWLPHFSTTALYRG